MGAIVKGTRPRTTCVAVIPRTCNYHASIVEAVRLDGPVVIVAVSRGGRTCSTLAPSPGSFCWTMVNGFVNVPSMGWEIVYYGEMQEAILEFPAGLQARYIHLTERMLAFGPDLGMPHTRAMGQGLFELRLKSKEGIARVLFCNRPGRRIMMLHAFSKKSRKTPAKELRVARQRMKEVQANDDA